MKTLNRFFAVLTILINCYCVPLTVYMIITKFDGIDQIIKSFILPVSISFNLLLISAFFSFKSGISSNVNLSIIQGAGILNVLAWLCIYIKIFTV